ncbi:MAG: hypothetical protein EXR43_05795 [Dehalococcoidia bacterium]|nr:hypothetical protein [Dehalococcoidia bacterium]
MASMVLAASNPAVAALRAEALRRAGIDFVPAADLNALKRALRTIRPDAVLLDLPLPVLSRRSR